MDSFIVGTLLASICLGSFTLFLIWINWRILKISENILNISIKMLEETIIIRKETILIRKISEDVLIESIKLRKALGDPEEETAKTNKKTK